MNARLTLIQQARTRVAARIREIETQLQGLDDVPASQPWVSFARITDVRDLRAPERSLAKALKNDLAALRVELGRLRRRETRVRRSQARRAADQMDREFKGRLTRALKDAEKTGFLDAATLGELCDEAEAVLEEYTGILERSPSRENMRNVLRALEAPMMLGGDVDEGAGARAFEGLRRGGDELRRRSERQFRGAPTSNNLRKYLSAAATSLLVGGDGPTERPPGLRKLLPVDRHPVAPGDTLSGLALKYYGKAAYWDVIYLANVGAMEHPDKLTPGVELEIP